MRINKDKCMSCGMCVEVCNMSAIDTDPDWEGKGYKRYHIDKEICIECGECVKFDCPGEAIEED